VSPIRTARPLFKTLVDGVRKQIATRQSTNNINVVVAQPDERHANRTASVLEWYDRHRAYNIWFKRRRN